MRRKDREVTEKEGIYAIMRQCNVMDVAFFDEMYPYIIPVNFGMREENGQLMLYVHGAKKGKKLELMAKNPSVAFCIRAEHELVFADVACKMSANYASVCGCGKASIVPQEQKKAALDAILSQTGAEGPFVYHEKMLEMTEVWQIAVDTITGKKKA